ncbi:hypothetical protein IID62_04645 [candidate division KSB1 bacterium]|nr:hypothetical protein [candidate division KSB1 bacterium]
MAIHTQSSFSDNQIEAIFSFQSKLKNSRKRSITLSEAIINWIALGYAEEYRNGFFYQENQLK